MMGSSDQLVSAMVLTFLLMGQVATAQIGDGAIVAGSGVRNGTPSFSGSGGSDDACACTEGVGALPDDDSDQLVYGSMIQVDDQTGGACQKCDSAKGSPAYPRNGGGSGGGKARRGGSWAPNARGGYGVCRGGYLNSGGTGVNGLVNYWASGRITPNNQSVWSSFGPACVWAVLGLQTVPISAIQVESHGDPQTDVSVSESHRIALQLWGQAFAASGQIYREGITAKFDGIAYDDRAASLYLLSFGTGSAPAQAYRCFADSVVSPPYHDGNEDREALWDRFVADLWDSPTIESLQEDDLAREYFDDDDLFGLATVAADPGSSTGWQLLAISRNPAVREWALRRIQKSHPDEGATWLLTLSHDLEGGEKSEIESALGKLLGCSKLTLHDPVPLQLDRNSWQDLNSSKAGTEVPGATSCHSRRYCAILAQWVITPAEERWR
jgi:hypothetical protein